MTDIPITSQQRVFPMQVNTGYNREGGAISEAVYMAAYEVYCHVYSPQEALIDLDGHNCRGGFASSEIIAFLYARSFPKSEWGKRVDEAFRDMKGIK